MDSVTNQLVAVTIYAAPPCHRDPRRQAGKLLLFPPGPPDGHAQSLQARVDLRRRHVESLRRETQKRLLVQLDDLDTDSTDGETKNLAQCKPFGDRWMFRPSKTERQEIGNPASAIDKQRRDNRLASPVSQLVDDIVQALRREALLSLAPFGDGGRRFRRLSSVTSHFLSTVPPLPSCKTTGKSSLPYLGLRLASVGLINIEEC